MEIMVTFAVGGKVHDANEHLMVIQHDSSNRLEAVGRQLVLQGLRMTQDGKFCDFAIVHGTHGLSMDCDWLFFERGEIAFRKHCETVTNLEDFATEYPYFGWIEQVGYGFMLEAEDDREVWLDFNTGRTVVSLKP